MFSRIFCFFIIFFFNYHSVNAGNKELAYEALSSGDFETAYREYSILAEENDPVGQFFLGTMYIYGDGIEKNFFKAYELLSASSNKFKDNFQKYTNTEDIKSMRSSFFWLGVLYNDGLGVNEDIRKGFRWVELAADLGHVDAASRTALNYYTGHGTDKNMENYVKYLYIAAEEGSVDDYIRIAWANLNGVGVEINHKEAFKWYKKSADYDFSKNYEIPKSYISLALMYNFGQGVEQDLDLAFKWFKRSADRGNEDSFIHVAYAYGRGDGTKKNLKKSFKWFKAAVDADIQEAYYPLAYLYANGEGTNKNEEIAGELIIKLAEKGDAGAKALIEEFKRKQIQENNLKNKEKLAICKNEFSTFDIEVHDCDISLENLHEAYVSSYRNLRGNNVEKYYCSNFSASDNTAERVQYCLNLVKGNIEIALEAERKKAIIKAYYEELAAQRQAAIRQQSINNLINIGVALMGGGSSTYTNPIIPQTRSFDNKRMQCTRTHETFFTCRPYMQLGVRTNCVIGNRTCQNGMKFGYSNDTFYAGGIRGANACRSAPNGTFMCN